MAAFGRRSADSSLFPSNDSTFQGAAAPANGGAGGTSNKTACADAEEGCQVGGDEEATHDTGGAITGGGHCRKA